MGLVAWYPLTADIDDRSSFKNHLSYLNNNGKLILSPGGKMGPGRYERLVVNDGTDYFRSEEKILLDHDFTMCCWAFVTDVHSGTANGLVSNHSHSQNAGAGITIRNMSSTDFRISCNTGSGGGRTFHTYFGTSNIKDRWAHLIVRYKKSTQHLSLWVDGVMEFEVSYPMYVIEDHLTLFNWSTTLTGGANYRPACRLNDVRIYDHALSQREITELARAKVLHYKFQEDESLKIQDCSGYNNHAMIDAASPAWSPDSRIGKGCHHFSGSNNLKAGNILGQNNLEQEWTAAAWIKLDDLSNSQLLVNFNHACRIIHSSGRALLYLNSGVNDYYIYSLSNRIFAGTWHHIAFVFRNSDGLRVIYLDGEDISLSSGPNITNTPSGLPAETVFGSGLKGLMTDLRVYATALSADAVKELYQTRANLSDQFSAGEVHETLFRPMNIDYRTWQVGATGNQPGFTRNGDTNENHIILSEDPWGKLVPIWEARPDDVSGADGGWNGDYFPIDNTKTYRFSVWVNRKVRVGSNGGFYLGLNGTGPVAGVLNVSNGANNTNPYFTSSTTALQEDEWVLVVGYVHPHTYDRSKGHHPDSGYWRLSGEKYQGASDFYWRPDNTQVRHRTYLYYCTDTSVRQQWAYPRVDLCDGNEPTIQELLGGFDSRYYDECLTWDISKPKPLIVDARGRALSTRVSEVGPVNGIVSWYPMGHPKDVAGGRHATNNGAVVTSGPHGGPAYYFDNADLAVESFTQLAGATSFTIAFWAHHEAYQGSALWRNTGFLVEVQSAGRYRFRNHLDGDWRGEYLMTFPLNEWQHVAISWDGETTRIYRNGVLDSSSTVDSWFSAMTDNSARLDIGRRDSGNMKGSFYDLRFYRRSLSAEEIGTLADIGSKMKLHADCVYVKGIKEF